MAYNLQRNQEHFSKYLPENMTWEEMDNLVEQAIITISMYQMLSSDYPSPWVKKIHVVSHLRGNGIDNETALYCTTICWQRLIRVDRVQRASNNGIGLPAVRPK